MRNFVFTPDWYGFIKWLQSVNKMKRIITGYEKTQSEDYKFSMQEEYDEAWKSYSLYKNYRAKLNQEERDYLDSIIKHHTPSRYTDTENMFALWIEMVISKGLNLIHEINDARVGAAIKKAREDACKTRTEISVVVGIRPETLKAYENGTRSIPVVTYYKLQQILDINLDWKTYLKKRQK